MTGGTPSLARPDVPGKGTSGHYCQHSVIQWNFIRVTSRRSVTRTSKKCNRAMRAMRNWSFISAGLTSIQGRRKRGGWGGLGRPNFWPLTPFDYERDGGLYQRGTTRTLLRCTGNVELQCLFSETRSRSVSGTRFFIRRTLSGLRGRPRLIIHNYAVTLAGAVLAELQRSWKPDLSSRGSLSLRRVAVDEPSREM